MTVKSRNYMKNNSVNLLYLIINKINGYIKDSDRNKYLILVPADESKDTLQKGEKLRNKTRDLIK